MRILVISLVLVFCANPAFAFTKEQCEELVEEKQKTYNLIKRFCFKNGRLNIFNSQCQAEMEYFLALLQIYDKENCAQYDVGEQSNDMDINIVN